MKKKIAQVLSVVGVIITAQVGIARAERYECTPVEVIEFTDRIHVGCSASVRIGVNDVWFIAISNGSSSADRFVSIAEAAILSGRKILFDAYPTVTASTPNHPNCAAVNCRSPTAFGFR